MDDAKISDRLQIALQNTNLSAALTAPIWCLSQIFREQVMQTAMALAARADAWSQLEGLGRFLLIDRLAPGWQARFLAPDFPSPFAVLREAVNADR
jgi:hypothetical protein